MTWLLLSLDRGIELWVQSFTEIQHSNFEAPLFSRDVFDTFINPTPYQTLLRIDFVPSFFALGLVLGHFCNVLI